MRIILVVFVLLFSVSTAIANTKCTGVYPNGETLFVMLDANHEYLYVDTFALKVVAEEVRESGNAYPTESFISSSGVNTFISFVYYKKVPYLYYYNATARNILNKFKLACHHEA